MKTWIVLAAICITLLVGCSLGSRQPEGNSAIIPDLKAVLEGKEWKGAIDVTQLVEKDGTPAIEFNDENFNLVWLDGFEFNDGTIEFDAKGKTDPPQTSFVGVAFRVVDDITYDTIYFRPFNFGVSDPDRRAHAVQYVSSPLWTWDQLRAEKPGQFEQPVEPAPDGDDWFHTKIEIQDSQVRVFVNGAQEPALQVPELSDRTGGSVGLYCYGYGVIANLQITPVE